MSPLPLNFWALARKSWTGEIRERQPLWKDLFPEKKLANHIWNAMFQGRRRRKTKKKKKNKHVPEDQRAVGLQLQITLTTVADNPHDMVLNWFYCSKTNLRVFINLSVDIMVRWELY